MFSVITCPALLAVENGMIVYIENTTAQYSFGTQAMYKCNKSYTLVSGDEVRTCVDNSSSTTGYWNGTAAICSGIALYYEFRELGTLFDNISIT